MRNKIVGLAGLCVIAISCQTASNISEEKQTVVKNQRSVSINPLEIPIQYMNALEKGTRDNSGKPGDTYWINKIKYDIDITVDPNDTLLHGSETIWFTNNSPDSLPYIELTLIQNLHKEGAIRNEMAEVTGGINVTQIKLKGVDVEETNGGGFYNPNIESPVYFVYGTRMAIKGLQKMAPGETVELQFDWNFKVPSRGASGRMGQNRDNLYYIGYFYPQISVYDDVYGWLGDQFQGNAEFYADFADYSVSVKAPGDWIVYGTGDLINAKDNLADDVYQRMQAAYQKDEISNVLSEEQFGINATKAKSADEWLVWEFNAKNVRDVAYSMTRESIWDASRTPVGDLDGDGETDYAKINAFYRTSAPRWKQAARYAQHTIDFLSRYLDYPYPWPHMTAVEGAGIIGGGMEYPMMTIMGDYNRSSDVGMHNVTAHELAHMWMPMILSSNERRYAWMDEGSTSFNENQSAKEFYPEKDDQELGDLRGYLYTAQSRMEGELMRWSDYHYNGLAYGTASYSKPATLLVALRGVLGDELFLEGWRTYVKRWAFKHPYPWDLFNTFNDVSGKDLDWFWRSWYYETWILDQAIESVNADNGVTTVTITDLGQVPMPVLLKVTFADGSNEFGLISVNHWLKGHTQASYTVKGTSEVVSVEIDPGNHFPDLDRSNNTWNK